jgi:hypothetical protein
MIRCPSPTRLPLSVAAAVCVLAAAGSLDAAPEDAASATASAPSDHPSKLDYLVLASIADAPHLLTVGAYRSTAEQRAAARPAAKTADRPMSTIRSE